MDNNPETLLIDVREPEECQKERVPGSLNIPLSQWNRCAPTLAVSMKSVPTTFICQSGARAKMAADKWKDLMGPGEHPEIQVEPGGIQGWKARGGEIVGKSGGATWSLFRQVQITVGPLIALSSLAALTVDSHWALLSLFLGLGLTLAGATGFCGLALLLAKAPWNRY